MEAVNKIRFIVSDDLDVFPLGFVHLEVPPFRRLFVIIRLKIAEEQPPMVNGLLRGWLFSGRSTERCDGVFLALGGSPGFFFRLLVIEIAFNSRRGLAGVLLG
jgi:hypothetical protein